MPDLEVAADVAHDFDVACELSRAGLGVRRVHEARELKDTVLRLDADLRGVLRRVLDEPRLDRGGHGRVVDQLADSALFGDSPPIGRVPELIDRVAPTGAKVLITGESMTGKELVARSLHASSARRNGPFIAANCGGTPATLIQAELLGYEKGSFTGAARSHSGLVQRACILAGNA